MRHRKKSRGKKLRKQGKKVMPAQAQPAKDLIPPPEVSTTSASGEECVSKPAEKSGASAQFEQVDKQATIEASQNKVMSEQTMTQGKPIDFSQFDITKEPYKHVYEEIKRQKYIGYKRIVERNKREGRLGVREKQDGA